MAGLIDQPSPEQQEDQMHADTSTDRVIAVDYGMSLQAMIAVGKYDWVDPYITAENFTVVGTGTKRFRTKVFDFGRRISSEDAVAAMKAENFTPGGHIHGLAFGAAFPDEQCEHSIACLGSFTRLHGPREVVSLGRNGGGRYLDLDRWDDRWYDNWRFLGVQEVSGA